jgi:cyanophycinase
METVGTKSRRFLLLGSGEFEPWSEEVERAALEGAGGDGRVVIAPTASAPEGDAIFERWASMGLEHYRAMGLVAESLPLKTREDAGRADLVARLVDASMIFFSGGKPKHLAAAVHGTPFWDAMLEALRGGAVFAGCSAGAVVASQMRAEREARGTVTGWVFGLGLVPRVSFGVHWDKMRYVPFMRSLVMSRVPAGTWFVGIDERTAILGDGERWRVYGRGSAMVRGEGETRSYVAGERFETRTEGDGGTGA